MTITVGGGISINNTYYTIFSKVLCSIAWMASRHEKSHMQVYSEGTVTDNKIWVYLSTYHCASVILFYILPDKANYSLQKELHHRKEKIYVVKLMHCHGGNIGFLGELECRNKRETKMLINRLPSRNTNHDNKKNNALASTVTSTIHWTICIRIACNTTENFSRNNIK